MLSLVSPPSKSLNLRVDLGTSTLPIFLPVADCYCPKMAATYLPPHMPLQCDFNEEAESVLPPLQLGELWLWWEWSLWLLRSGDKKLLVLFVPPSLSDPVIMPWRSPSMYVREPVRLFQSTALAGVPADSQHQLPIGMTEVSSVGPKLPPAFKTS